MADNKYNSKPGQTLTDIANAEYKKMITKNIYQPNDAETNYSVNQVAEMVGGDPTYVPARPAESRETRADNSKIIQLLGWQPKFNLEAAINSY